LASLESAGGGKRRANLGCCGFPVAGRWWPIQSDCGGVATAWRPWPLLNQRGAASGRRAWAAAGSPRLGGGGRGAAALASLEWATGEPGLLRVPRGWAGQCWAQRRDDDPAGGGVDGTAGGESWRKWECCITRSRISAAEQVPPLRPLCLTPCPLPACPSRPSIAAAPHPSSIEM
jgi:hypothetical protein